VKPLAIDLFCGLDLFQAKFFWCANALVDQFMASGAKNPDHMWLGVLHLSPRTVALEFRTVGQFQYPTLSAGLARLREFWMFPSDPCHNSRIFVRAARIVNRKYLWVSLVEVISAGFSALYSAALRAVSAIAVRGLNLKVSPAYFTGLSVLGGIILFTGSGSV
jgi:hypothetical protein